MRDVRGTLAGFVATNICQLKYFLCLTNLISKRKNDKNSQIILLR